MNTVFRNMNIRYKLFIYLIVCFVSFIKPLLSLGAFHYSHLRAKDSISFPTNNTQLVSTALPALCFQALAPSSRVVMVSYHNYTNRYPFYYLTSKDLSKKIRDCPFYDAKKDIIQRMRKVYYRHDFTDLDYGYTPWTELNIDTSGDGAKAITNISSVALNDIGDCIWIVSSFDPDEICINHPAIDPRVGLSDSSNWQKLGFFFRGQLAVGGYPSALTDGKWIFYSNTKGVAAPRPCIENGFPYLFSHYSTVVPYSDDGIRSIGINSNLNKYENIPMRYFYDLRYFVFPPTIGYVTTGYEYCFYKGSWYKLAEILYGRGGDNGFRSLFSDGKFTQGRFIFDNCSNPGEFQFENLFSGCTGLKHISGKIKIEGILSLCSFRHTFGGCSSLENCPIEFPISPIVYTNTPPLVTDDYLLGIRCCEGLFYGCTNMVFPPQAEIDFDGLRIGYGQTGRNAFADAFYNCKKLESIILTPTNIPTSTYAGMFRGCTNLNYISFALQEKLGIVTQGWMDGVSPNGTFRCPDETYTNITERTADTIPEGWEYRGNN